MVWRFCVAQDWPTVAFTVLATDADDTMIERAKAGCYGRSSLKELPEGWVERAFIRRGDLFCVASAYRDGIEFALHDIRQVLPEGPFDLILCRNLVFTYFDEMLQRRIADRLRKRLCVGGFFVLGSHEALPADVGGFALVGANPGIYRREA
jgi:chemotaxis protein methyltransferase CheR